MAGAGRCLGGKGFQAIDGGRAGDAHIDDLLLLYAHLGDDGVDVLEGQFAGMCDDARDEGLGELRRIGRVEKPPDILLRMTQEPLLVAERCGDLDRPPEGCLLDKRARSRKPGEIEFAERTFGCSSAISRP